MEKLLALSLALQSFEILRLRPAYADSGIWRWSTLRKEGGWLSRLLTPLLAMPGFHILVGLQLLCAVALFSFPHGALVAVLFATALLICIRWRGTVNGGSDFMTLQVLMCLGIACTAGRQGVVAKYALTYVAVQLTLSYFVAGVAKAREKSWWTGEALREHLSFRVYGVPPVVGGWLRLPGVAALASWTVMAFELGFPVVWLRPELLWPALYAAAFFHLANAYVLGLNRFFWAWLAAYPALWFCVLNHPVKL
jgi:hypothetical protein